MAINSVNAKTHETARSPSLRSRTAGDLPDGASRQRHVAEFKDELLGTAEILASFCALLKEDDSRELPEGTLDRVRKMHAAAAALHSSAKSLDHQWPELEDDQFFARFKQTRHDLGNLLNPVFGHCQLLLEEEEEDYFGALVDDFLKVKTYCNSCQEILQRFQVLADGDGEPLADASPPAVDELILLDPPKQPAAVEPATVMVVDDSDDSRELMVRFLSREGHRMLEASRGDEALALLEKQEVDLILLDVIMPGINGVEVLKRLRTDDRWKSIPVIMVSSLESVVDIVPCISLGAHDYLTKPVEFALLRARVTACLERKRSHERQLSQFFTPELARYIVRHPAILQEGRNAEVTVLFVDIRGFSRISERLEPMVTVSWVRAVLAAMSHCVIKHGGVLVDYVGDEVMAMWGAPEETPNHADRACRAAIEMLAQLPILDKEWAEQIGEPTRVGIGLNTGTARVGNVGTDRKFKYGPLGATVNLASRVQGATKYLKTELLITKSTQQAIKRKTFAMRRLCQVRAVNIDQPVELFEVRPQMTAGEANFHNRYEEALEQFEQGSLPRAAALLGELLNEQPDDGPSLLLMSRVVDALLEPQLAVEPVWTLPGK